MRDVITPAEDVRVPVAKKETMRTTGRRLVWVRVKRWSEYAGGGAAEGGSRFLHTHEEGERGVWGSEGVLSRLTWWHKCK